jgi:hypothetical protein
MEFNCAGVEVLIFSWDADGVVQDATVHGRSRPLRLINMEGRTVGN